MARRRRRRTHAARGRSRGPKRRWLLLVALLVTLALAEVALRAISLGPTREAPDVVMRLRTQHAGVDRAVSRADVDPRDPVVRFRTDARGYVEPVATQADPELRVAFLGGSTTECRAVREELRFPALAVRILAQRGTRAEALNAGGSASTVHDLLYVLLDRVARDGAHVALLMEAANDAGVLARDGGYGGRSGAAVTPRDLATWSLQLAAQRLALAELLRSRLLPSLRTASERWPPDAKLTRPAPRAPYRAQLEAYVALARAFGIEPWLATQPLGYVDAKTPSWVDARDQEAFNGEIRSVAAERGVPLVDLAARVAEHPDFRRPGALFYDGLHVTDAGSQVYAKLIAEALAARGAEPADGGDADGGKAAGGGEPAAAVESESGEEPASAAEPEDAEAVEPP